MYEFQANKVPACSLLLAPHLTLAGRAWGGLWFWSHI